MKPTWLFMNPQCHMKNDDMSHQKQDCTWKTHAKTILLISFAFWACTVPQVPFVLWLDSMLAAVLGERREVQLHKQEKKKLKLDWLLQGQQKAMNCFLFSQSMLTTFEWCWLWSAAFDAEGGGYKVWLLTCWEATMNWKERLQSQDNVASEPHDCKPI